MADSSIGNLDQDHSKKLLELSSDPENQALIVQEASCMEGIVNYLRSKDEATVTMAAQCVDLLASNPCNRKDLFHQKDLISNIVKLTESECEAIQRFAVSAAQSLNRYATSTGTNNENSANCDNVAIEKPDAVEKSPDAGDADACADEERGKSQEGEKEEKEEEDATHVLQVSGMNDEAIISRIRMSSFVCAG